METSGWDLFNFPSRNEHCLIRSVMTNTSEELATTVSGLLGMDECVHHETPPMEEDIDEDIRSMVASMCGGGGGMNGSSLGMKEVSRPREVGKQVRNIFQGLGKVLIPVSGP